MPQLCPVCLGSKLVWIVRLGPQIAAVAGGLAWLGVGGCPRWKCRRDHDVGQRVHRRSGLPVVETRRYEPTYLGDPGVRDPGWVEEGQLVREQVPDPVWVEEGQLVREQLPDPGWVELYQWMGHLVKEGEGNYRDKQVITI